MKDRIIQALLTKFLTDANIKLSLPVILSAIITVITYQTIKIGKISAATESIKTDVRATKEDIKSQIDGNNMVLFTYGLDILGTWVNKMAESQKTTVEYLQASEREKKLIIKNIDTGTNEVIEKARQKQHEIQMIKPKPPDSLRIMVRPLNGSILLDTAGHDDSYPLTNLH